MPLKTLLLNPPSFENFDGAPAPVGPPPARLRLTGTRYGWRIPPDMLEGARLLDAPPHTFRREETIKIARDYEFRAIYSTPGFPGDIRSRKR